ncbi:hypothetical protein HELRODRAFT_177635 [Helobdella robusta]|uniref:Uncharacterized protein n=1 Tax=Helobdella robusta TaxID=6412 RepID=T1FBZ3_HELRO|nr:hypothetical protein HELRODRAFT_177635 [Helobdella robusta]ESN97964.1 hypothetical protein HELRODRAFT_177635 [Helobdella robusta]
MNSINNDNVKYNCNVAGLGVEAVGCFSPPCCESYLYQNACKYTWKISVVVGCSRLQLQSQSVAVGDFCRHTGNNASPRLHVIGGDLFAIEHGHSNNNTKLFSLHRYCRLFPAIIHSQDSMEFAVQIYSSPVEDLGGRRDSQCSPVVGSMRIKSVKMKKVNVKTILESRNNYKIKRYGEYMAIVIFI